MTTIAHFVFVKFAPLAGIPSFLHAALIVGTAICTAVLVYFVVERPARKLLRPAPGALNAAREGPGVSIASQ